MNKKTKILVIRNDHIGDLVLAAQVFKEIKKKLPNSEITLICSKANREIIKKDKSIDHIFELDITKYDFKTIWNYSLMSLKIRKMKFDYGIDLRGSNMNSMLLYLAGIKKRASRVDFHKTVRWFVNIKVKPQEENHITEDNIEIINSALNIKSKNHSPKIVTDKSDEKSVSEFLKKNNLKEYICVCPITGKDRQWSLDSFREILKGLKKYKADILLLGTGKDEEILESLEKENKKCKVVLDFNIRQLALLFRKSRLVIAQDGGPMHIAWVSGARLISLFPKFPEGIKKMIPLKNSDVIKAKNHNMNSITIEEVEKKIEKVMGK